MFVTEKACRLLYAKKDMVFVGWMGNECPVQNKAQIKRLEKEKCRFRKGEVDLDETYWSKVTDIELKVWKKLVVYKARKMKLHPTECAKLSESAVEDVKKLTTVEFWNKQLPIEKRRIPP